MNPLTPDLPEELVGVRAWRLVRGNLWSLYRPVAWLPGRPVRAECLTAEPPGFHLVPPPAHRAPQQGCRCGLYAAFWRPETPSPDPNTCSTPAAVLGLPDALEGGAVLGEVAGWGRAELYTKGFRCEWAGVRAIFDTHPEAGAIAEAHDVPLVAV